MTEITINNLSKSFNDKVIFKNINLEINEGEKIAFIGSNGVGKTTLFKILLNKENYEGVITFNKGIKIGYLEQISKYPEEYTVKDVLIKEIKYLYDYEKELRELELEMSTNSNDKLLKRYGNILEKYEKNDGYNKEDKLLDLCLEYNIDLDYLDKKFNTLSGGEKTIINLASIMINKPNVLLLDEPTNHLDIKHLEILENFINNFKGTVILISHDRYFLDKVVNKIILIENKNIEIYHGNYSYYVKEKEKNLFNEFNDYKDQQKLIKAMKEKIIRLREYGYRASPEGGMFFKRAESIQKRLDKIEILDKPLETKNLNLKFDISNRSGVDVLTIDKVRIGYDLKNQLFKGMSLKIKYKDKICLMGDNGLGKSTLIKSILYNTNIIEGSIKLGTNVKISYLPQEIKFDNEEITIYEYVKEIYNESETIIRTKLSKFLFFEEDIFKKLNKLSGGEKIRLKLLELIEKKSNFLILDEPTNHIDIETRELLEDTLNEFEGTILFISHDRYFINKVAKKILNIENHRLKEYFGNYDYFREKQLKLEE